MTDKLYALTDAHVTITLSGYAVADVVAMTVTLSITGFSKTYTLADGDIVLGATTATLHIDNADIATKNVYRIHATFTDSSGNVRGLKCTPELLQFD